MLAAVPANVLSLIQDIERSALSGDFSFKYTHSDTSGWDFVFSGPAPSKELQVHFSSSDFDEKLGKLIGNPGLSHIVDVGSFTLPDSMEFIRRSLGLGGGRKEEVLLEREQMKKSETFEVLSQVKAVVDALAPQSSMVDDVELVASELLMNAFGHSAPGAKAPSLSVRKTAEQSLRLSVFNQGGAFSRTRLLARWQELACEETRIPRQAGDANDRGAGVGLFTLLERVSHLSFFEHTDGVLEVSVLMPISKRFIVRNQGNVSLSFDVRV